ncbi:BcsE family c-di-GMP-binding protein [Photobacterium sp. OFAV2-7]|uniref:BcsE family c-di-GMP-binding protein n=1 Tax=Photobacterium sp. OFAV2-7 TaxID=2917748 RepID=UPI001EF73E71|nr:BcsE family c-di-GMP-binding protein [Photobacterium sp. OFAV2-7]MCG7586664.1 hypothetical protein [Photobacterium sp. OFAV2-7]
MTNFILSEDDNVISLLETDPCSLRGPHVADSDYHVLLFNTSYDCYQQLSNKNKNKLLALYHEVFFLKSSNSLKNIVQILDDIEKIPLTSGTTLFVLSDSSLFSPDNNEQLSAALSRLKIWQLQSNIAVYFCVYDVRHNKSLVSALLAHCNQIESTSLVSTSDETNYQYTLLFAHTKQGIMTNADYDFDSSQKTYTPIEDKAYLHHLSITDTITDNREILTLSSLLKENEIPPTQFRFFETPEEILEASLTNRKATIVFPCVSYEAIEEIARFAFQLRTSCGLQLKIIVRELIQCISYFDERLLLDSGVNLIVPAEVSFSHFVSQTLAIQNQVYVGQLPEKYEDLLNLRPRYTYSGQSDITLFTQHVKSLISQQMSLRIDFALLRLNKLPSQDITECASLCKLRRDGDLLTIGDGVIYVFLSAIRANDIDDVLNGIFHLKVSELFSSYCVFINPVDIIEELTNATTPHLNKSIKSKPTRWRTSKPLPSHKTTTRVYAKRVPLERKSQRVLP